MEKKTKTKVIDIIDSNSKTFLSNLLKLDLYFANLSISKDLFKLTRKVEIKNVDKITQGETGLLIIKVPEIAFITKFVEIIIISRKTIFLIRKVQMFDRTNKIKIEIRK